MKHLVYQHSCIRGTVYRKLTTLIYADFESINSLKAFFDRSRNMTIFVLNNSVNMESIGEMIRRLRLEKGEPIRVLAAFLQIDQALMSKMERGLRNPTREQVEKLAHYFGVDRQMMLVAWLSDRIVHEVEGEDFAGEALQVAEEKVVYQRSRLVERKTLIRSLQQFFDQDGRIKRAWLFGSFARGDEHSTSDIDLMVEEENSQKFSYFDLSDIQFQLEQLIHRKVDIGFVNGLKKHAAQHIQNEAVLIYEKQYR
jgi:predicted nucleotidyltransferase/plasmid maintenance system antidote protein VapI